MITEQDVIVAQSIERAERISPENPLRAEVLAIELTMQAAGYKPHSYRPPPGLRLHLKR